MTFDDLHWKIQFTIPPLNSRVTNYQNIALDKSLGIYQSRVWSKLGTMIAISHTIHTTRGIFCVYKMKWSWEPNHMKTWPVGGCCIRTSYNFYSDYRSKICQSPTRSHSVTTVPCVTTDDYVWYRRRTTSHWVVGSILRGVDPLSYFSF